MGMLSPKETHNALANAAITKTSISNIKLLILSIFAGAYISLGAQGFIVAYDNVFLRAGVFPVGLMMIVIAGGELFTGDCLMTFGLMDGKIDFGKYVITLIKVLIGNAIGAMIIALFVYHSGFYNANTNAEVILKIANSKLSLSFIKAFFRGILCNILVTLAVIFATSAKDISGKILACWFPIMLFVLAGYEHIVANMFYLPLANLVDPSVGYMDILIKNYLPVTIGNYISGGIFVPVLYHFAYKE